MLPAIGITPAKKLIYLWLILWVGGLGPLTYLETFSPHAGLQPYHLTILEPVRLRPSLGQLSSALADLLSQRLRAQVDDQFELVAAAPAAVPGFIYFLQGGLSQGDFPSTAHLHLSPETSLGSRISTIVLSESSAWLPPPEKPPALNSAG